MNRTTTRSEQEWPVSWKAAQRAQVRSMAESTPAQRLDWLEHALRLALASGALSRAETASRRRRRGLKT